MSSLSWFNGLMDVQIDNLVFGNYILIVIDENVCIVFVIIVIFVDMFLLVIEFQVFDILDCVINMIIIDVLVSDQGVNFVYEWIVLDGLMFSFVDF